MPMFMMGLVASFGSADIEDEAGNGSLAFSFMLLFNALFVAGWLIAAAANFGS
jgi:hypothetical protein